MHPNLYSAETFYSGSSEIDALLVSLIVEMA